MKKIKVWDIGTRLFHWLLVIAFSLSAYSAFQDKFGIFADIHLWSGFTILVLIVWRFLWGVLGSETAKFSSFLVSPIAAVKYLRGLSSKDKEAHIGHNPLGGYSVILMLVVLLTQAILGLYSSDGMFFSGPLADNASDTIFGSMTAIHETLGYILFGLVGMHICAVLFYAIVKRVNLVWPMITGRMLHSGDASPKVRSPLWALVAIMFAGGVCYQWVFGF